MKEPLEMYTAVIAVQANLPELLPPKEAESLRKQLDHLLVQPESPKFPLALSFAMQAIHDYEAAEQELIKKLGGKKELEAGLTRLYSPTPGYPIPIAPGTQVCCPVNPSHLKTPLRTVGQRCPVHNCLLTPCDLLASPTP